VLNTIARRLGAAVIRSSPSEKKKRSDQIKAKLVLMIVVLGVGGNQPGAFVSELKLPVQLQETTRL